MNFFRKWLRIRRMDRYIELGQRLARIRGRLEHMDPNSDEAEALYRERVWIWNRRNELALKLQEKN